MRKGQIQITDIIDLDIIEMLFHGGYFEENTHFWYVECYIYHALFMSKVEKDIPFLCVFIGVFDT